jgi:hypothetical protein
MGIWSNFKIFVGGEILVLFVIVWANVAFSHIDGQFMAMVQTLHSSLWSVKTVNFRAFELELNSIHKTVVPIMRGRNGKGYGNAPVKQHSLVHVMCVQRSEGLGRRSQWPNDVNCSESSIDT